MTTVLPRERLGQLHRKHYAWMIHIAIRKVNSTMDAEDIVQGIFLRLYEKPHTWITIEDTKIPYFLYAVTRHACIDFLRKQKRQNDCMQPNVYNETLASSDEEVIDEADRLYQAMREIPRTDRRLLMDRFVLGYSYNEIAARHQISPSCARKRVERLRKKIKEKLLPCD